MTLDALPLAESFFNEHEHQLTALGTVLLVIVAVFLVDRAFKRRGKALAARMSLGGRLDPTLETRLRFVRRAIEAIIVVIGLMIALSQFTALDKFAASILASSAIAAAVIGFAAQQTLGNLIAGIGLAVTQPIRIGDRVSFEGHTGVVEDIRLAHTVLQTGMDARIIVPNAKLAGSVIRNDSIVTQTVAVETEFWLDNASDELRALEVIGTEIEGASATISAVTFEGTTLLVSGPKTGPAERLAREAELRRDVAAALRRAQLR
jgi:small-conductance mechanosensitive channel